MKNTTSRKKRLLTVASLGTLPLFYGAVAGLVFTRTIAAPARRPVRDTPESLGLKYEDVTFTSRVDNLKLRAWYIPGGKRGTVITVHGGRGNRTDPPLLPIACDLAHRGFNTFTFDRRDCGESEHSSRSDRWRLDRDVAGAYDFLRARSGSAENIFMYGTSMGALATVMFAAQGPDVKAVVLDSAFPDTPKTLKRAFQVKAPVFTFLVPGMILAGKTFYGVKKFSAIDYIGSAPMPILFIQSSRDRIAPVDGAYELYRASKNPSNQIWVIDCGEHSRGYEVDPAAYIDRVVSFFDAALKGRPQHVHPR